MKNKTFGRKERYVRDMKQIAPPDQLNHSATVERLFVDANGYMSGHFGQLGDDVIDVFAALFEPLVSKYFVDFGVIFADNEHH